MLEERPGNDYTNYLFNSKELDEESGMYYYSARYYSPPIFTARDPMEDKMPWVSPYAYCANNPLKYIDPTGMIVEPTEDKQVNNRINPDHKNYNKEFHELYKKLDADQNTVYTFNRVKPTKKENGSMRYGELTCNGTNDKGQDRISINYTYAETGIFSPEFFLFEETAHAEQFMNGDLGFELQADNTYEAFAVDKYDEANAKLWAAQNVSGIKSVEEKNILNSNKRGGIEGVVNSLSQSYRGLSEVNISAQGVFMQKNDRYAGSLFNSNGTSSIPGTIMRKPKK